VVYTFLGSPINRGKQLTYTFPETNIASENPWLADVIFFWEGLCSRASAVDFRDRRVLKTKDPRRNKIVFQP